MSVFTQRFFTCLAFVHLPIFLLILLTWLCGQSASLQTVDQWKKTHYQDRDRFLPTFDCLADKVCKMDSPQNRVYIIITIPQICWLPQVTSLLFFINILILPLFPTAATYICIPVKWGSTWCWNKRRETLLQWNSWRWRNISGEILSREEDHYFIETAWLGGRKWKSWEQIQNILKPWLSMIIE